MTKSIQLRFQYQRLDRARRHSKKKFRRKKRQQMVSALEKSQKVERVKEASKVTLASGPSPD
ncbi:MAG: hypothetical protein MK312_10280, partial [Roseibacillus sp.]|nr:hypothetical protein [Roseibacillus sp.]